MSGRLSSASAPARSRSRSADSMSSGSFVSSSRGFFICKIHLHSISSAGRTDCCCPDSVRGSRTPRRISRCRLSSTEMGSCCRECMKHPRIFHVGVVAPVLALAQQLPPEHRSRRHPFAVAYDKQTVDAAFRIGELYPVLLAAGDFIDYIVTDKTSCSRPPCPARAARARRLAPLRGSRAEAGSSQARGRRS